MAAFTRTREKSSPRTNRLSKRSRATYCITQCHSTSAQQAQAGGVGDGQRKDDGAGLFVGVVHDGFHDGVLLGSAADDEHQLNNGAPRIYSSVPGHTG